MFKSLRSAVVLGALGIALFACTVGSTGTTTGSGQPQQQGQLKTLSGMTVTASISAVTLGDECASAQSSGISADCAPSAPGSGDAKVAPGGCGGTSYCQQSNVQIAFNAGAGTTAARVEVVSVTLHDSASGNIVGTLTSSKPQAWTGNGYTAWDQTIPPAGDLKASYNLSAPTWSTITSGGSTTYSTKYKLQVTLRIDGAEIILESTNLNREPQVAT